MALFGNFNLRDIMGPGLGLVPTNPVGPPMTEQPSPKKKGGLFGSKWNTPDESGLTRWDRVGQVGAILQDMGEGGSANQQAMAQMIAEQQRVGLARQRAQVDSQQAQQRQAQLEQFLSGVPEQDRAAAAMDPEGYLRGQREMNRPTIQSTRDGIVSIDPRTGEPKLIYEPKPAQPQAPAGYEWDESGALKFIPGGPADPEFIGQITGARRDAVVSRPLPPRSRVGGGRGAPAAPPLPPGFVMEK